MKAVSPNDGYAGTIPAKAALLAVPVLLKVQIGRDRFHFSICRNGLVKGPCKTAGDALSRASLKFIDKLDVGKIYLRRDQIELLRSNQVLIKAKFVKDVIQGSDYSIRLWRIEFDSTTSIFLYQEIIFVSHLEIADHGKKAGSPRICGYWATLDIMQEAANFSFDENKKNAESSIEKLRIYEASKEANSMLGSQQVKNPEAAVVFFDKYPLPLLLEERTVDSPNRFRVSDFQLERPTLQAELRVVSERQAQDYTNQTASMLAELRADASDALCFISEQAIRLIPGTNVQILNDAVAVWCVLLGKAKSWFYRTKRGDLSGPWVDLTMTVSHIQKEEYERTENTWSVANWASFTKSEVLPVSNAEATFVAWRVLVSDLEPFYVFSRYDRAIPVLCVKNEENVEQELQSLRDAPTYRPGWRAWGSTRPILY